MLGRRSSAARLRRRRKRPFVSSNQPREAPHSSLDSLLRSFLPGEAYGDNHLIRAPGSSRVVFQNIDGLPDDPDDVKHEQLNTWLKSECVGVALLAEMNRFWPAVPQPCR